MKSFSGLSAKHRAWLVAILACGFVARVVWMFALPYYLPVRDQADPTEYNVLAKNLLAGEGYRFKGIQGHHALMMGDKVNQPTTRRPPLYPLLLAGVYGLVGERYRAAFLLNCIFDVVTMIAVFAIARQLFEDARIALLALGITASHLPFFQQNIVLMSESLAMMLTTLVSLALVVGLSEPRARWFVLAGIALGLTGLARPEAVFFSVPFALALVVLLRAKGSNWRPAILLPLATLLLFWVVLSPWVIRNAIVFGRFIPGTTVTGSVMLEGLYPPTQDESKGLVTHLPAGMWEKVKDLSEIEANDVQMREAIKLLLNNPMSWLRDAPLKVAHFWLVLRGWSDPHFLYYPANELVPGQYSFLIPNLLFLIFAGVAVFRYRGRWLLQAGPIIFTLVFLSLQATFYVTRGRHCVKMVPSLIVLAAYGMYRVFSRQKRGGEKSKTSRASSI